MAMRYDRSAEDLGNIVLLDHVNVRVPDQRPATLFYIAGLGLTRDPYLLMADFGAYVRTQYAVDAVFADRAAWAERALRNIAGMGRFSVDRTIGEYASRIWHTHGPAPAADGGRAA